MLTTTVSLCRPHRVLTALVTLVVIVTPLFGKSHFHLTEASTGPHVAGPQAHAQHAHGIGIRHAHEEPDGTDAGGERATDRGSVNQDSPALPGSSARSARPTGSCAGASSRPGVEQTSPDSAYRPGTETRTFHGRAPQMHPVGRQSPCIGHTCARRAPPRPA